MLRKPTISSQRKIIIIEGDGQAKMNQNERLLWTEGELIEETEDKSHIIKCKDVQTYTNTKCIIL